MSESFFNKVSVGAVCNFKKKTPRQLFSCDYCKIRKNTYFEKYLRTAAFVSCFVLKLHDECFSRKIYGCMLGCMLFLKDFLYTAYNLRYKIKNILDWHMFEIYQICKIY